MDLGRAEHKDTRYHGWTRSRMGAENIRQLTFDWSDQGEALEGTSQGLNRESATDRSARESGTGALAQGLIEAVVAEENMQSALKRVRANKGAPGVDGMTVDELPEYLEEAWPRLKGELLEGQYEPQAVQRVGIPKPDGGVRELGIPTVVDRLIQQAVLQVLTPMYDPTFSDHSYGYRPGRSAHHAIAQARKYITEGNEWVVDIDLEKFFDRVNHDVLMGRLAKRIGDKRLLRLVRRYLEAGVMVNGVVMDRGEGTPQGGPLSPLLANILLDELDKELERRGHAFCRYADDCNIYVRTPRAGERVMKSVSRFVERKLRLKVNQAKSKVARISERTFLGLRIVLKGPEVVLRVAPESLRRFKDRVRRVTRRSRGRSSAAMLEELGRYTDGWVNYYWVTGSPKWFENLDGWIRRRVRCYAWVQWKTPKKRVRELRRAGVDDRQARWLAYDGLGPWPAAAHSAVQVTLTNRRLANGGYRSLATRYKALASL